MHNVKSDIMFGIKVSIMEYTKGTELPHKTGVYLLTYDDKRRYIGSSKDFYDRLDFWNSNRIESITVFMTSNEEECRTLEKEMIRNLKPELNLLLYDSGEKPIKVPNEFHTKLKMIQANLYIKYKTRASLGNILILGMPWKENINKTIDELTPVVYEKLARKFLS